MYLCISLFYLKYIFKFCNMFFFIVFLLPTIKYVTLLLGADLLPTDFQPADNYCLLAAHIFTNVWEETGLCLIYLISNNHF